MKSLKIILKVFWALIAVIAVIAVFIGMLAVYNQIALQAEKDKIIPKGQKVDLGAYSVHVYTEGENNDTPTLVFLSGSATVAPVYDFKPLYSLISSDYQIAVVEKAGYGYSDIADVERDVDAMVNEVRSALTGAEIKGPYILLPHSMAGLEAIYWAQNYPNEVLGIIGIDMSVPDAYDEDNLNIYTTKKLMTLGMLSRKLGLLRIPGVYPLNETHLTDEEASQQRLLMYRNAVNSNVIAEGQAVFENAKVVKADGKISCSILMFCSDGMEIGDFWVRTQKDFARKNDAEIVFYDCGHYIHYYKSKEMVGPIKDFIGEIVE